MRIAIEDNSYNSLLTELPKMGHEVVCYVAGIDHELLWPIEGVTYAKSSLDMFKSKIDLCITTDEAGNNVKPYAEAFGVPVIGHSDLTLELEANREFACQVIESTGMKSYIKIPERKEFISKAAAATWLRKQKASSWVLKQHRTSPLEIITNRTFVSDHKNQHLFALQLLEADNSAWFKGDKGGVRFERFIEGTEICWGSFWALNDFISPIYWCQEHKEPQNNKRSGILTGEVGTLMGVKHDTYTKSKCKVSSLFYELGNFLTSVPTSTASGMIDINTIVDAKGDLWFVEFTTRWGRPTLEMQIAMSLGNKTWLDNIAHACSPKYTPGKFDWTYVYNKAIGVTVFDYGLPYMVDPNRKSMKYKPPIGSVLASKTKKPSVGELESKVLPFLTNPAAGDGLWMTMPEDARHFVSIGLGTQAYDGWNEIKERAYIPLKDFNAPGMTWRDDIGDNADTVQEVIECFKLL
jgi:phosphoribosylamine-glycine ligase